MSADCKSPCAHCPWRTENHHKPHPDGWYTAANRRRLWAKLRRGEAMSCHPTDPKNPISEKAAAAGVVAAKEGAQVQECIGAIVLQQREVMRFQTQPEDYLKRWPKGMTRRGLIVIVERTLFGSPVAMPKPDLNEPVGHDHDELPWEPK